MSALSLLLSIVSEALTRAIRQEIKIKIKDIQIGKAEVQLSWSAHHMSGRARDA